MDISRTEATNSMNKTRQEVIAGSPGGHKRSLSGSILFPLFGSIQGRQDASKPTTGPKPAATTPLTSLRAPGGAMASVVQQKLARKRKGSLRKTALLGRGKSRLEGKEEYNFGADTDTTTSKFARERPLQPLTNSQTVLPLKTAHVPSESLSRKGSPITETRPLARVDSTASTTDEDEIHSSRGPPMILPSQDSYFPPQPRTYRARLPPLKSPLSSLAVSIQTPEQEWDYSETAAWGWVLLVLTWIVFVVGMGSCFGLWSWAWDVGQTPYAPPELEDDPTLPIVGYYPALMILTGVMAWVWVVVAWVGMKYFRHAKISGDAD